MERNISDSYRCYRPFSDYAQTIDEITDFNGFVGDSVGAFLDDNNYRVNDYEEIDYYDTELPF